MSYVSVLIFVLQTVGFSKAELKLNITLQNFNGTEVPIFNVLQEIAGTNLVLTCKLVNTTATKHNDTSNYFDSELSWGWNRANLQFNNVTDLQNLANDNSKPLLQFLNKSDLNHAAIAFHSLSLSDSGKYFCMSFKYKLFNIVKIDVVGSKHLRKYNTLLRSKRFSEKGSVVIPKVFCSDDMFICNSRTSCIKYEYVCDNVTDCTDGSDENKYVCGRSPCEGKANCSNGRCISSWLCCDYSQNITCMLNPGPSCCSEIMRANKATYITSNNIALNTVGLKSDEWTTYRRGFEGGEYNNWNDFNNPALRNSHGFVTRNNVDYNFKLNSSSTSTSRSVRKKFLWILLSPIIVIVIVMGTLAKMWEEKCKTVPFNTETVNPSFGSNEDQESYHRSLDLPPSYDEAIRISR